MVKQFSVRHYVVISCFMGSKKGKIINAITFCVVFFFSPFASRRDLPIKYVKNYESFLQSVRKYYRVSCGGYIHSYVPLPHSPIRIVQSAAAIYFATRKAELASIVTAPFLFSEAPNIVCGGCAVVKRVPVKMIEIFLFF